MKTKECLYFGNKIVLTPTEDLCCRKQLNRSCRVYKVYKNDIGDKFVRIHQGNSTCVLVKHSDGKDNDSFIYAKKDTPIWRMFMKEITRKENKDE